jgi:transposase-like protein
LCKKKKVSRFELDSSVFENNRLTEGTPMGKKVLPSESTGKRLASLLEGREDMRLLIDDLMRTSTEHVLQELLEKELTDYLGRGHHERRVDANRERGMRNGYVDRQLKTSSGKVRLRRPRVRGSDGQFESEILRRFDKLDRRLSKLITEMYSRGLSTRDIEETLTDEEGKPVVRRSSVSRITDELMAEYEGFCNRDLGIFDVVYLFVDGVYESIRRYTHNQALLCAWGICSDGKKVLLHLECVASES